jgi:uncharacterized membrane protein (UPF0127 family)
MAKVTNATKGTVVADDVRIARSMWSRFWGLMGRKSLPDGQGLLLDPCSSVHMFFMRFPIDVVFLDRENKVVKVVSELKPYRTALGGRASKKALELPARSAERARIEPGDVLTLEG